LNFLNSFSNNTHIKFHENPSGGSRVVSGGQSDRWMDGQTLGSLMIAFRNFANAPKNEFLEWMLSNAVKVLISFDVKVNNLFK